MPSVPTLSWERSRHPLAWTALAAIGGILVADGVRHWWPDADDGTLGWVADGLFLTLVATLVGRPGRWRFWVLIATGFGALHFFNADPLPAAVLAHALDAGPPDHVVRATGVVVDVPRVSPSAAGADGTPSGGINRRFRLKLESLELDRQWRWDCHATVGVDWRDGPRALAPGDRLEVVARAFNTAPPRNPGEFDRADFLRREGVRSEFALRGLADGRVRRPGGPWQPLTLARGVHDWMQDRLCLDLRDEPEVCAVVSTMLLGLRDRPGLGSLEGPFQRTGTLHYFAIDGLKLGLLAFLILRALVATGMPRPWAGLCILPLLLGYALATGLGAASARAVVVAAVLVGGEWIDRPARPINSLGAAAAVLLLLDTNQLFEMSFQLSFMVVLSLLTLARPVRDWLWKRVGLEAPAPDDDPPPWPRRALGFLWRHTLTLTSVAIAAWVGSVPLMLLRFHLVSPVSPVANVVAFPLAFTVLALGVFSLAGAVFSQTLAVWMNNTNWLVAKLLLLAVRAFDAVPGGSVAVSSPEHWRGWGTSPALEMVVLDVGGSRAAWMRAGGADWLIDCARPFDYLARVRPCLEARAVRRLDGLLLTQDDAAHAEAAPLCRTDFSPRRVVFPATATRSREARELRAQVAADGVPTTFARRGDVLPLSFEVSAHVLYPPDGTNGAGTAADRALALRFEARGWRVWWVAAGDGAACRWLLAHADTDTDALDGDVLVTTAPVSPEWLRAVKPRLVIVRPPVSRRARKGTEEGAPLPPDRTIVQEDSGAVTMEIYSDRIEAHGFVDGKRITVRN